MSHEDLTQIEAIHWIDSRRTYLGWDKLAEYQRQIELDTCWSVGFVIDENDKAVTLVQSVCRTEDNPTREHPSVTDAITIPRVAILERHLLDPSEGWVVTGVRIKDNAGGNNGRTDPSTDRGRVRGSGDRGWADRGGEAAAHPLRSPVG